MVQTTRGGRSKISMLAVCERLAETHRGGPLQDERDTSPHQHMLHQRQRSCIEHEIPSDHVRVIDNLHGNGLSRSGVKINNALKRWRTVVRTSTAYQFFMKVLGLGGIIA